MNDFLFGFVYPLRSLRFFFAQPKIILYSIVPMIINLIIYGTIFLFTYKWIIGRSEDLTGAALDGATFFQEFLHLFIIISAFFLLLIICYLLFITFGGLINAPFEENISQQVERIITGSTYSTELGFWKEALLSIKAEAMKLLFYFSIIIPLFLINFIPMIGSVISTVGGTGFSFFYNALDYLDYPMTRRFYKLRKKIKVVNAGGALTYGFGCAAFILMFLPIVNVFFKPVLVVAGTSLFYEKKYFNSIEGYKQ